jgi:hypothetical protein
MSENPQFIYFIKNDPILTAVKTGGRLRMAIRDREEKERADRQPEKIMSEPELRWIMSEPERARCEVCRCTRRHQCVSTESVENQSLSTTNCRCWAGTGTGTRDHETKETKKTEKLRKKA